MRATAATAAPQPTSASRRPRPSQRALRHGAPATSSLASATAATARSPACHITSSSATWVVSTTRADRRARAAMLPRWLRAAPTRARTWASAADRTGGGDDQPGAGVEQGGGTGRQHGDEDQPAHRHPAPELAVEHAVDVVDDRGEDVAATRTEAPGVSGTSASYTSARRRASSRRAESWDSTPLGVAQHRSGQAEGADGDDGDEQGQDGRLARGLHDQPARGGGEGDARGGGEAAEDGRQRHPACGVRRRRGERDDRARRSRRGSACSGAEVAGAARWTTWSARATRAGRWATTTTARSRESSTRVSATTCSVSASRWAVGSSSRTQGRSAQHDPGQGEAGALAGREGGAVLAERGVETLRQLPDALLERHPAEHLPDGGVVGVGRAQADVVGDAAGHEERPLGEERDARAPGLAADRYAVDGQPAAVGGTQPGQHREQGGLAAAGGTGDRGDAASGAGPRETRSRAGTIRPG